jgi:CRISPR-associated endonuclease Cas1
VRGYSSPGHRPRETRCPLAAASPNSLFSRKSGALVVSGFGIKISRQMGEIHIEDGVADDRRIIRLPRVTRHVRRIIVISSDGYCTFEGLRSIADIGATLIFLDKRGKLLFASGPTAASDVRLRRSQSLALTNGTALRISKELIRQKIEGQAALVRDMLNDLEAAVVIAKFSAELTSAERIDSARLIESQAAKTYWGAWADVPVRWPRKDELRIPEHWKCFKSRISPLTHSPRLAANPPNAILNLLYSLLEAEARIAAVAMGLDPDIGMLHVDTPNRSSLACDLQEPIRPKVDAFILNWLQTERLRKADFWEDTQGNCRICSPLVIRLCETGDTWRRLVAPVAEHVAQQLWSSIPSASKRPLATRLTQRTKRKAKGSDVPQVRVLRADSVCRSCGRIVRKGNHYCQRCAVAVTTENFDSGRKSAQSPEHLAKRSSTMRRHKQAIRDWNPSDLPAWLTRDVYVKQIQPALASVVKSQIRSMLGVSEPYSSDIRAGKRIPHPRHWQSLAELTGASPDSQGRPRQNN